jgi:hypothetical protein
VAHSFVSRLPKTQGKAPAVRPVQIRYAGLGLLATD